VFAQVYQKRPQRLRVRALAATARATTGRQNQLPVVPDQVFVDNAIKEGMYGLLLGTLAVEKSRDPHVRTFAENMIRDNQRLNIELTSIAERKGITPAKVLDPQQRTMMQQLSQLSGQDFDCRFLVAALNEHKTALETLKQETQAGRDKDLQRLASNILPKLRSHLNLGRKAKAMLETRFR